MTAPQVNVNQTRPVQTVADIYQVVGDDIQAEWVALGNMYSGVHWLLGKEAAALIPELPAGLVYEAIGKKAGIDPQIVRKAFYTWRDTSQKQIETYPELVFSIFQHAAKLPDKQDEILQYAQRHQSSVREIQALYPVAEDEQTEGAIKQYEFPRYFYGIVKEARLVGKFEQVKEHLDAIREILCQ